MRDVLTLAVDDRSWRSARRVADRGEPDDLLGVPSVNWFSESQTVPTSSLGHAVDRVEDVAEDLARPAQHVGASQSLPT